jgi:hypothetical protein
MLLVPCNIDCCLSNFLKAVANYRQNKRAAHFIDVVVVFNHVFKRKDTKSVADRDGWGKRNPIDILLLLLQGKTKRPTSYFQCFSKSFWSWAFPVSNPFLSCGSDDWHSVGTSVTRTRRYHGVAIYIFVRGTKLGSGCCSCLLLPHCRKVLIYLFIHSSNCHWLL